MTIQGKFELFPSCKSKDTEKNSQTIALILAKHGPNVVQIIQYYKGTFRWYREVVK